MTNTEIHGPQDQGGLNQRSDGKNTKAEIREDFIKRLFAVAISVGFATTLTKMKWVENGSWPACHEWEQLSILTTGLFLTVASWDGYLASIKAKPLNGDWRFGIDILLVFIYMFFLISSQRANFWHFGLRQLERDEESGYFSSARVPLLN